MNTPDPDAIRQALVSGEFHRAGILWSGYAAKIEEEIRKGSCTAARIEEARQLVEWSGLTARCARAHLRDRLRSLQAAARYAPAQATPPRLVRASL